MPTNRASCLSRCPIIQSAIFRAVIHGIRMAYATTSIIIEILRHPSLCPNFYQLVTLPIAIINKRTVYHRTLATARRFSSPLASGSCKYLMRLAVPIAIFNRLLAGFDYGTILTCGVCGYPNTFIPLAITTAFNAPVRVSTARFCT